MKISENWRIESDEYNVVLLFHEMREKTKKDGSKEMYEYQEKTYHKTIKGALSAYLHKQLVNSESIQDCLDRINEVEKKIEELDLTTVL